MKNLKNYLACVFIVCFINAVHAQAPAILYQKSYGSPSADAVIGMRETIDGGYIALVRTDGSGGNVTCSHGNADVWILKLDSAFVMQWQKCYGGTCHDYPTGWLETNDGGCIIISGSCSNDGDVSGNHGIYHDIWVLKLDSSFDFQWQKCLGGSGSEFPRSIRATSDGGYIISGDANSNNDGDVGANHGQTDVWIIKTDSLANIQWQRCYGGSNIEYGISIEPDVNGGYTIGAETESSNGDVSGHHGSFNNDYWMLRIDSIGNILSQGCYGGTDEDRLTSFLKTDDGGYLVTGYEWSDDGDVTGHYYGTINSDIWMVKTDSALNLEWQKCLGGNQGEWTGQTIKASDGNYIIAGSTESNDHDVSGFHSGSGWNPDFWMVKIDSAANIIWQKCIGGLKNEMAGSILQTKDSNLVVSGYTESGDLDAFLNTPQGYFDAWMIKLAPHYNAVTGKIFLDTITNGIHDASEPVIQNALVSELSTGRLAFSDSAGNYELPVFTPGLFTVQAPYIPYYPMSPSAYPVNFSGMDLRDSLNDFAGIPLAGMNDLSISITPCEVFVAGYSGAYCISYKNIGTTTLSATVKLFPDNALSFISASIIPSLVNADSAVWSNINLVPYQSGNIIVHVSVSGMAAVTSSCSIEPLANDQDITNNFAGWTLIPGSSFDPNEKMVSDSVLTLPVALTEPFLNYVVCFQNTGTAAAVNIKILDNISKNLNMNTFELISSSHPVQLEYQAASRQMTFRFDNIMLPDSNSNEQASHGFVTYRVRTKANLQVNNKINNQAHIYFDFNPQVSTAKVITTVIQPTAIDEVQSSKNKLNVFPNPAYDKLFIKIPASANTKYKLTLFDVAGRSVLSKDGFALNNLISADVRNLVSGIYVLELKWETAVYNLKVTKQ